MSKQNPRKSFPSNLRVPRHIAIIMDGNGRWAKSHRLARIAGHRKGAQTVRDVVMGCIELGVDVLSLYAFSEENWKRPEREIRALMMLLKKFLLSERKLMKDNDIRFFTIGETNKLPLDVQRILHETIEVTKHHKSISLVLALSYGGRSEITRAVREIAGKVEKGSLRASDINEQMIADHLDTRRFPDPDLLIRTSGEFRISNFLPWQSIYSELYVTNTLWPEFSKKDLYEAVENYSSRERRFGMTSEQLAKASGA